MVHRGFSTGRAKRARGIVLAAVLGLAVVSQVPAHASTAAPTLHIQDGGSNFINAAQASTVSVAGTYNATDANIVSIEVSVPNTGGTCAAGSSPTIAATLFPADSTWVAGPFDVTNDADYPQGVALCATAQAIAANPVDNSAIAVSDNLPVKDTIAPAAPTSVTIDNPINKASQGAVNVAVTGEAGTTALITVDDADTHTAAVVSSILVPGSTPLNVSTLADGTLNASAVLRDAAGNAGPAGLASATKDATAPAGSVVLVDANGYMDKAETLAGSVPANWSSSATDVASTSVWFEDATGAIPAGANCGPFAVGQSGNGGVNATCAAALPEGQFFFAGKWTDALGNVNVVKTSMIKDTFAPGGITIAAPADGSAYAPGSSVTIAGTAPAGSTVRFSDDNGVVQSVATDGSGNWSKVLSGLKEGNHYLQMRAVDAAGNEGPRSEVNFLIDRLVPQITSPNADVLPAIFSLAGKGKANSEALLYEGNVALGRVIVSANGTWVKDLSLSDGVHQLTARGVGTDGRVSGLSAPFSVLVDSSRPTVAIATPANNAIMAECGTTPGALPLPPCPLSAVFSPIHFAGTATDAGPANHMGVKSVDVKFVNALTGTTAFVANACTNCGLNVTSAAWSLDPVIPLPGYYDVIVTSKDFAGNVSTTAALEVVIL